MSFTICKRLLTPSEASIKLHRSGEMAFVSAGHIQPTASHQHVSCTRTVAGIPLQALAKMHTTAPLLPHTNSSSSRGHTQCARRANSVTAVAAVRDGSRERSSGQQQASAADSDASKQRVRSRHYYDSTPRYKSSGSSGKGDSSSFADAVADAFGTPFTHTPSSSSRGSSSSSGRRPRSSSSKGVSTAGYIDDLEDDDDEEVQGRGWWEVPREQRKGAAADPLNLQLEPWQEKQLLLAAASSKKKIQVQAVAASVGLDRTQVLAWVAAFRAKPQAEQAKLLAPLQQQIDNMKAQQQAQSAAAEASEAARRSRQQQQRQGSAAPQQQQQQAAPEQQQQQQGLPFSGKNPDTGFVPFAERRGAVSGSGRGKRLPAEVLRTLEGMYARGPWPNKEVVSGLFDLHRLPRDVVLEWFAARRAMDGLPDNPRAAKQLAAAAAAAAARVATDAPQPLLPAELLPGRAKAAAAASAAAAAAAVNQSSSRVQQPQPLHQQEPQERTRVQRLTAREMAALRSGLPSPRKQKGERLRQELGVKAGADAATQVEIAGVTFVAKDGRAGWRKAWRKRRSATGIPAQQLDFNLWLLGRQQQQQQQA